MLNVRQLLAALVMLGVALPGAALDEGQLLDPKDAFRLTARAVDAHTVLLDFRIAHGYYLYRDRFRFETASGAVIPDAVLPPGKMKDDPFFGRTETYRDHVAIRVPLAGVDLSKEAVKLKVISQGCADVGVCYIPQTQWVEVKMGR